MRRAMSAFVCPFSLRVAAASVSVQQRVERAQSVKGWTWIAAYRAVVARVHGAVQILRRIAG